MASFTYLYAIMAFVTYGGDTLKFSPLLKIDIILIDITCAVVNLSDYEFMEIKTWGGSSNINTQHVSGG